LTFNKTNPVKEEGYQYLCVEDTKLGCLAGGKNIMKVGGKPVISLMDKCLPRTNSIKDKATLVKAEAALTTDTTTDTTTGTDTTTDTTTGSTTDTTTGTDTTTDTTTGTTTDTTTGTTTDSKTTGTTTKGPKEKKVIALVTAGVDTRIVPRGYGTTEVCKTSEECNVFNKCATTLKNGEGEPIKVCLPNKVCKGNLGSTSSHLAPG
jgi:hypothetical protein